MNNATTLTNAYTTTLSDVAAVAAAIAIASITAVVAAIDIASTAIASTAAIATIAFTRQRSAGEVLIAASAAAKAIKLPTTFDAGIDDKGIVATEITQEQTRGYLQSTTSTSTQEEDLQSTPSFTSSSSCNHADMIVYYISTDNNKSSLNLIFKLDCDYDCDFNCDCDRDRYDKHTKYSFSYSTILCGNDCNALHFENVSFMPTNLETTSLSS